MSGGPTTFCLCQSFDNASIRSRYFAAASNIRLSDASSILRLSSSSHSLKEPRRKFAASLNCALYSSLDTSPAHGAEQ